MFAGREPAGAEAAAGQGGPLLGEVDGGADRLNPSVPSVQSTRYTSPGKYL